LHHIHVHLIATSMSSNQDSTLGAAYNAAKGTAQSTYASVTGNTGEQVKGETNKNIAAQQNDASQAAVKAGPVTATPSGTAVDNQDRQEGSWKQTAWSLKQGFGGLVGSTSLQHSGEQQRQEGEQQQAKGQLSDYASGKSIVRVGQ